LRNRLPADKTEAVSHGVWQGTVTIDAMRPDDWPAVRAVFRERIAPLLGVWRDTLLLEWRDPSVGSDTNP
jgi:hypothetical protein